MPDQPRFSIVSAVYNVARYLPDYIKSLDEQTFTDFEVIAVDDGSTDESLSMLREWADRSGGRVRVLTKENGGQGSARNLGLEHARGEWVTFTDPDDMLVPECLAEIDRMINTHPDVGMVAANLIHLLDRNGKIVDTHAGRFRFEQEAVRDLTDEPGYVFGNAPAAFFRTDQLIRHELRFDDRVQPNFEDGHFTSRYLLTLDRPTIGFVPTARYIYRRRTGATSTLAQSTGDPRRYTVVLRYGYLDLLQHAGTSGEVPRWVKELILYELSWILSVQTRVSGAASPAVMAVAGEFHDLLAEIMSYFTAADVDHTSLRRINQNWRAMLGHGYRGQDWVSDLVDVTRYDHTAGLVELTYRFVGEVPAEQVSVDGQQVVPKYQKVRDLELLGRTIACQRILWVPLGAGEIEVRVAGETRLLRLGEDEPTAHLDPSAVAGRLDDGGELPRSGAGKLHVLAASWPIRRIFRDAWVLMDRVHDAGDSGQVLFEYLRAEHREINAWFVIEKGTVDWHKLRARYGRRVVGYGTLRWKLLLANAAHLLSSHADQPIVRPPAMRDHGVAMRWKFTFLQHGVIKDDLSNWLNPKPIRIFVTSTPDEQQSVVADHTRYRFTEREAKMTGLPRFDRLLQAAGTVERPDLLLLAPTWRNWLAQPLAPDSQRREVTEDFFDSDFYRAWWGLLGDDRLHRMATSAGLRVGFMPHPNLQPSLADAPLPDGVELVTFSDDIQRTFARAAVMVTDYSSMAFNAAYLDRPVVYYQFDFDRMMAGEHVGSRGYFDYRTHGFGPVTSDLDGAVAALEQVVADGGMAAEYRERVERTFPLRDGRCCQRVVEAVLAT